MGLFENAKTTNDSPAQDSQFNFMEAIEAHMRWKTRLQEYVNGTNDEPLDAKVVESDDRCVLGKWIYGPGETKYRSSPLFQELVQKHALFHQCVGAVVKATDAGSKDKAMRILTEGDYLKASQMVTTALARFSRNLGLQTS